MPFDAVYRIYGLMGTGNSLEKRHFELEEVEVLNLNNPKSMLNLLPEKIRERVLEVTVSHPEWFNVPEGKLKSLLRSHESKPYEEDEILRSKLWIEYERTHALGLKQINMAMVTSGVCSRDAFHNWVLRSPARVAWLMCVPVNYRARLSEMLYRSQVALQRILQVDPIENGEVNMKLAQLQVKIFELLDLRIHGAVVQKHQIEQKTTTQNLNYNVEASSVKDVVKNVEGDNLEALKARYEALEKQRAGLYFKPEESAREVLDVSTASPEVDMTKKIDNE